MKKAVELMEHMVAVKAQILCVNQPSGGIDWSGHKLVRRAKIDPELRDARYHKTNRNTSLRF